MEILSRYLGPEQIGMSEVQARGKDLYIKRSPVVLYDLFSDLRRFEQAIPQDKRDQVTISADSVMATVQGMEIGLKIDQRVPFSLISFAETGKFPFPFRINFHFQPVELDSTLFHIDLSADLPMMAKMMLGGKLQEAVDKFTEQIENAINGQMPTV